MFYQFWVPFIVLTIAVATCERKWCMLRDPSQMKPQPYSWSRVQLAMWSIVVLSSFIAIMWYTKSDEIPRLHETIVILLGISGATTAVAKVIDTPAVGQNVLSYKSEGFFLDILSDDSGVSISRFQTVVFNLVFAFWFISKVLGNLSSKPINEVMPIIEYTNLALLGLSSVTYAALKSSDKKAAIIEANKANETDNDLTEDPAVG